MSEILSELLRAARDSAKKTQSQIADEVDVTQPLVTKWERGEAIPQPAQWRDVAAAYGIPITKFMRAAVAAAEQIAKRRAA